MKSRIVHSHSSDDQEHAGILGRLYKQVSIKIIGILATRLVGCGPGAAQYLFPHRNDVVFIPNSIDIARFAAIGERSKRYLIDTYHLSDKCLKLIQVGRLLSVKNHEFTIQMARRLNERGVDFAVFLVGRGELRDCIAKKIEQYGLAGKVFMLGDRSDIPELMAGADVMLMPSLYEGFPLVLVESQATGTPALISDTISCEVDLGVGLVAPLSLDDNLDVWIAKAKELAKIKKISKDERIAVMVHRGFDVRANLERLECLYS